MMSFLDSALFLINIFFYEPVQLYSKTHQTGVDVISILKIDYVLIAINSEVMIDCIYYNQ